MSMVGEKYDLCFFGKAGHGSQGRRGALVVEMYQDIVNDEGHAAAIFHMT